MGLEPATKPGYHLVEIPRAPFGTAGKIQEEVHELIDAEAQGIRIMMLAELSDLVGSIKGYLERHFPDFTLQDLDDMAKVTKRAFDTGSRS